MKPLYLTAHYDDLEVCAGGTAARYGGYSAVLFPEARHGTMQEADEAAEILGIGTGLGTALGLSERDIVTWLDRMVPTYDIIISVSPYDSHPEHRKVADIARQVARNNNTSLWFMDHTIPGGQGNGPRPNTFVDFSDYQHTKYDAIECYSIISRDEVRSIMYRDRYYGRTHGGELAEGFITESSIQ